MTEKKNLSSVHICCFTCQKCIFGIGVTMEINLKCVVLVSVDGRNLIRLECNGTNSTWFRNNNTDISGIPPQ